MSIKDMCLTANNMLALKPLPGRMLVELREKYEHVATTEQKYDALTSGICISLADDTETVVLNKRVFFEEYKAHTTIERDGKKYAFVKIEDLDGWEDV